MALQRSGSGSGSGSGGNASLCRGHKILFQKRQDRQAEKRLSPPPHLEGGGGGKGILPYMGYFGMCSAKGYGFSAALVINRVSILAILPPLWL